MMTRTTRFSLVASMVFGAVLAAMPNIACADAPQKIFDVQKYGAVPDGKTMNTQSLQKAIDACGAAGGGRVLVPAGTYLTGPIQLRSNVDLHVEEGATVLFSRTFDDYPLAIGSYEGKETVVCTSPLSGDHLHDVSITGKGSFDGQGEVWRPAKKDKFTPEQWKAQLKLGGVLDKSGKTWYPSETAMNGQKALAKLRASDAPPRLEDYAKYRDLLRPVMVLISNSKNVRLDGPTFKNSANWDVHPFNCDGLIVRNVTIDNPIYAQNGDGIDIDSCRNVQMTDCRVNAGDDAICLKSGRDEEGRKFNHPTENVTISNCWVGTGHGGIVIGSEMSGGVHNVHVSDCTFDGTDAGLRFKTTRGRGNVVQDIHIRNIRMSHIRGAAIEFNMYYAVKSPKPEPVSERTPQFRDFHIRNITCESAKTAMNLHGLPEMPIQDITIENADLTADKPGQIVDGKNITLKNVHIHAKDGGKVKVENVTNLVTEDVEGLASRK